MTRKESKIKESSKTIGKLEAGMIEITSLLEDTLNVKLRYEEIIKRIMQNEESKSKEKKLSVRQIVKQTPIDASI